MSEKIYGIDMGTNSIKIYQKAAGVILHQKNMIAMVKKKAPLALGDEAYSMYEKAPENISVSCDPAHISSSQRDRLQPDTCDHADTAALRQNRTRQRTVCE